MLFAPRLSAIAATVLLLSACNSNRDRATLSLSLGATREALSLEGVDVTRFTLTVTCVDGTETTVRGDLDGDGAFSADVPRCPQAIVRFEGLLADGHAALAGSTQTIIRPPSTDVVIPVLRVGTVSFVNDGSVATICAVADAQAPDFDGRFLLEPGASSDLVLPTTGVSLTCVPASTCATVATCTFSDASVTVRPVTVAFGGVSTVNLAAPVPPQLIFTIGPPTPSMAGQTFGVFEVTLVDQHGIVMPRSDITVSLVPETPTPHGGFSGASIQLASGVGRFLGVTFTTAGQLSFHATALVDGAVINSQSRVVTVLPGVIATLKLDAPGTLNYVIGQAFDVTVSALDPFGNVDSLYTGTVSLGATPLTEFIYAGAHQFTAADAGVHTFTGVSVLAPGPYDITATDDLNHTSAPLAVSIVSAGTLDHFEVTPSAFAVAAGDSFTVTVRALDPAGDVVTSFNNSVDITSPGAVLRSVPLSNGQGATSYSVTVVGTVQVYASYGAAFGVSAPINVTAAAPYSLAFLSFIPSPVFVNAPFGFTAQVQDVFGNPCDPTGFSFTTTLNDNATGALLSLGYVTNGGDVVHFDYFSVDRPAAGVSLSVAAALPAGDAVSNTFDVTTPTCPIAYAFPGASGSTGCDPLDPVGTISAALAVVSNGGEIRLALGTFNENVTIASTVTISGGYDTLFATQSPLNTTTIKGLPNAFATVSVFGNAAWASISDVLIAAPDASVAPEVSTIAIDGGGYLYVERSRLVGVVSDTGTPGNVVRIGTATEVRLRNNWINLGDTFTKPHGTASTRHGIYDDGSSAAQVTVVHNTFYVPVSSYAEALFVQGAGQYTFTNNLVVGDFSTCNLNGGSCALRDVGVGLGSAQTNYFVATATGTQTMYFHGSVGLTDVNAHGGATGAAFAGNVVDLQPGLAAFPAFTGPDSNVATMDDNDWHLQTRAPFDIGLNATQTTCGPFLNDPCGGDGYDIDGELRGVPACVGADEAGGPVT